MVDQNNFESGQNFQINLDQIYNDFIGVIDSVRSEVNITDPNNQTLFKKFTTSSFTGGPTTAGLKIESTPQESRCHAFYRIIGFPVMDKNYNIYNPGLDTVVDASRKVTLDVKVSIANNLPPGFEKISEKRETYLNNFTKIFFSNTSIDAQVYALSSVNVREFNVPFVKNADAIESSFDPENQSYDILNESFSGVNTTLTFNDYVDASGEKAKNFSTKRYHIIKPFLVDPRIDLTTPSLKKIAIPFVSKIQSQVSENFYVKQPVLEKVIKDRFIVSKEADEIGTLAQSVIEEIKNTDSIKDQEIVKQITSGNLYKTSEKQLFAKYFYIIQAMMQSLAQARLNLFSIRAKYYWLPTPSTSGPEKLGSITPIFTTLPVSLSTSRDQALIKCKIIAIIDSIQSQVGRLSSQPDYAAYNFENYTVTYSDDTTESFGDINAKQLQTLNESRDYDFSKALESLRQVEIIMGEFSGLGLCDIFAIMAGLYLMPRQSLLGFLDADAYTRARQVLQLKELPEQNAVNAQTAIQDFTKVVQEIYVLMDKLYTDAVLLNQISE